MPNSFYTLKPESLRLNVEAEHATLKEAEKNLRTAQSGDWVIVQVVREAHVEEVPSRLRVKMHSTRTRVPRDPNAPRRARKPRKGAAASPAN